MNDDEYPPEMRAMDAISGIVSMTPKQIADRAEVPLSVVRKVLKKKAYYLEEQDGYYRAENAQEAWVELDPDRPLPSLYTAHSVRLSGGKKGYEISFPDLRPQKLDTATEEEAD